MSITVIDIIIAAIILLSCMMGAFRGLVREALSLATWIGALLIATFFYEPMGELLSGLIDNSSLRSVAAFSILFILAVFIGTLISQLFTKMVSAIGLRGPDRLLGALFGVLRGLIIVGLVVLLTYPFEFAREWFAGSALVPWIVMMIEDLQQLLGTGSAAV